jgi:5-formyltetrahydrofolate cyclo-ligase
MSPESAHAEKSAIRQRILSLRGKLPAEARTAASERIAQRLLQLPQYQSATSVLAYMNYGSEVASELVVRRALADGKRVALPRVNRITDHLDLYWVQDLEHQLLPGSWGIREPVVAQCERLISPNEVEFALLPGVAFCRDGSRLGYGGGYFDKLLATPGGEVKNSKPTLVAAAFALQIVEALPQLPTDIKVGWIVTEQETIDCGN